MNCMRCSRDIQDGQVFCPDCLAEMEKYPVKPDTPVRLPRRPDPPVRRTVRKKGPSEEEQIRILKKRVRVLCLLLAIATAVIILLSIPVIDHLTEESISLLPGQNYTSDTAKPAAPE